MSDKTAGDYTDMVDYYNHLMLGGYYDYAAQADALRDVLPAGAHILEVGIGTGLLAERLLERGYRVTGIDITDAMLEKTRALLGDAVPLSRVDLSRDTLAGTFDAAISNGGVWYAVGEPDEGAEAIGYCGHIIDDPGMVHSIDTLLGAIGKGGALVLSIQPRHADKTMALPEGVTYRQNIVDRGGGVIEKEYLFIRGEEVLSRLVLPLRYYDPDWFLSQLAERGFGREQMTADGRYMVFRRDGRGA